MLKMLALKIDKDTYPIAAALLKGGFLMVPEEETYGCIVVINQIVGQYDKPVSGSGAARYSRFGGGQGRIRYAQERTLTFENTWYDRPTFEAEFDVNTSSSASPSFWEITRKPEPDYSNFEGAGDEDEDEDGFCEGPTCSHPSHG